MNGSQITASQHLTLNGNAIQPDASWSVAGIGDFNGDGNADILWRNANGSLTEWSSEGPQVGTAQRSRRTANPLQQNASWAVAGMGDFNGDGEADILWRNSNGALTDWAVNGAQITSAQHPTLNGNAVQPDASWTVAGIGDFSGDGNADILWRNANGSLTEW